MDTKQVFRVVILVALAIQVTSTEIKTVYTNGYYYSQYFPLEENMASENTLRFSVRTSRDAHILLSPSYQADGLVYEIVLGAHNNTMTYIRGRSPFQEEPSATIRTVELLNDQEFRYFWIRIKVNGRRTYIQVGMGGKDTPFQEWRDPRPLDVRYLSFRSGTLAEWKYGYSDAAYTTGVSIDKRQTAVTSTGYGQYFPLSEVVSHSYESITLYFTVRTPKEFLIIFSPKVRSLGDVYEFGISEAGACLRRRHSGDNQTVYENPGGFFNEREAIEFWIKLTTDGQVMLGKGRSPIPLLHWWDPHPIYPQFVSFSLHSARNDNPEALSHASLQYGLGPDYTLASQDCTPRWKESPGQQLPTAAVRGGHIDQVELFVCRANHDGNILSGSFAPGNDGKGVCEVSWYWNTFEKTNFEVLTGCGFTWVPASLGKFPKGSITAGDTSDHKALYVARASLSNKVIIGRLFPNHLLTYAVFKHLDLPFIYYEVLVHGASGP